MTRQQNKYKNIFILLCVLLVIISLIGGYLINHYTKSRMGMQRHVIYLNNKWEKILPIGLIKKLSIVVLIVLSIISSLLYFKSRKNIYNNILFLLTSILNIGVLYFLIFNSLEENRAYYLLSICFIIASLFQNLLWILNIKNKYIIYSKK